MFIQSSVRSARLGAPAGAISILVVALLTGTSAGCSEADCGAGECPAAQLAVASDVEPFRNGSGASRIGVIEVVNVGASATTLSALQIEGGQLWEFQIREGESLAPTSRVDIDVRLEPGQLHAIEVVYLGADFGVDGSSLAVFADAAVEPALVVELSTVDVLPMLASTIEYLDFDNPVGKVGRQRIELVNSGAFDARIVAMTRTGSEAFDIVLPEPSPTIAAGESLPVEVTFRPQLAWEDEAVFEIHHTWGGLPDRQFVLDVHARGFAEYVATDCLEAVALGEQVRDGDGAPVDDPLGPRDVVTVERRSTVRLTGLQSSDPDGDAIAEHRWRLTQVPPDFVLDVFDDRAAQFDLELLQAGTYVFELDVFDAHDETSCEPGRLEIEVVP